MQPGGYATPVSVKCEVCETPQLPATNCVECGMPLKLRAGVRPVADPPIERLFDLEPTQLEVAPDAPTGLFSDLEVTVQPRVAAVPLDYVPGFEPTAEEILDLPGGIDPPLPGLERTTEDFDRTPPPPPGVPTPCVFCGFVQPSGRLCNNCGRARTRVLAAPTLTTLSDDEVSTVRCRSCGAAVKHFKLCSDCGMPLPDSTED